MTHIIDTILESFAPPARRYPVTKDGYYVRYGPWRIEYDPPPIPNWQDHKWQYWHDAYDGAEDSRDNRCGACGSFAAALDEIDEIEDGE